MKLPGKRDRLRRTSADARPPDRQPADPATGSPDALAPAVPEPAPEPSSASTAPADPASAEPADADAQAPDDASAPAPAPGPTPAPTPTAPTRPGPALLVAVALLLAAALLPALMGPTARTPTADAPSAADAAPDAAAPAEASPSRAALIPMAVLDDPPSPAATEPALRVHHGGPVPDPLPAVRAAPPAEAAAAAAEAATAYAAALAASPPAPVRVRRDLARLADDPGVPLAEPTRRWLRAAWPALEALEAAAAAPPPPAASAAASASTPTSAAAAAPPAPTDARQRWDLALAALALGRDEARGGAPAQGARWAVAVARLGRRAARRADLVGTAAALGRVRMAETWLADAVERYSWSAPELAWLRDALAAPTGPLPGGAPAARAAAPAAAARAAEPLAARFVEEPADRVAALEQANAAAAERRADLLARVEDHLADLGGAE